jgi:cyanophycinase
MTDVAHGPVFLIGGGWDETAFPRTYGGFVAAVGDGSAPIACILLDHDERDAFFARSVAAFAAVGATGLVPIFVSRDRPLTEADVRGMSGIFVGGGLTPEYHDAIVPTAGAVIRDLVEAGMPYAGFSAGAMIAPVDGIIGGWKLRQGDDDLTICSEDVSEDEAYLDVRQGIGLVPFAVDVHASQYGTPTRLLHAVRAGTVPDGWAVDEDTMIVVEQGRVTVSGLGSAYRVLPAGESLAVTILGHGDTSDVSPH